MCPGLLDQSLSSGMSRRFWRPRARNNERHTASLSTVIIALASNSMKEAWGKLRGRGGHIFNGQYLVPDRGGRTSIS